MQVEQFIFHRVVSLQNDEDVDESNIYAVCNPCCCEG